MTQVKLAALKELEAAFAQTQAIGQEFRSNEGKVVDLPLSEMFNINHWALLELVERYADDLTHGTMQAIAEGKLPEETSVIGEQIMATAVRFIAMGVILERGRSQDQGVPTPHELKCGLEAAWTALKWKRHNKLDQIDEARDLIDDTLRRPRIDGTMRGRR